MHQGAFAKNNSGPRTPRPPGAPPVLDFLVRSVEGLPSTRNWPFRWPLSPVTHQPAPGDTQGNVSRQPPAGRGGGFGGWSCTSAGGATRGQRALLRFFNSSGEEKRAVPRPSRPGWPGRPGRGMAELRPLFPGGGGQGEQSRCFFARLF
jgi:hypothetical protein